MSGSCSTSYPGETNPGNPSYWAELSEHAHPIGFMPMPAAPGEFLHKS
jgi:hypothetical protein